MPHIKLFESYFDKSDALYEIISHQQFIQFIETHEFDEISNEEIETLNKIFNSNLRRGDIGKLFGDSRTKKLLPSFVHKYKDGWWVIILWSKLLDPRKINPTVLCDRTEGIIEYKNSDDYKKNKIYGSY